MVTLKNPVLNAAKTYSPNKLWAFYSVLLSLSSPFDTVNNDELLSTIFNVCEQHFSGSSCYNNILYCAFQFQNRFIDSDLNAVNSGYM